MFLVSAFGNLIQQGVVPSSVLDLGFSVHMCARAYVCACVCVHVCTCTLEHLWRPEVTLGIFFNGSHLPFLDTEQGSHDQLDWLVCGL